MNRTVRSFGTLAIAVAAALPSCASAAPGDAGAALPDTSLAAPAGSPAAAPSSPATAAAPAPNGLLPQATEATLANGMRVFLVPDHEVPLVAFEMRLAGGSVEDAAGKEGAAGLLATLLNRGAGDRDAAKFQEEVEFVGGSFGAWGGAQWLTVSCEFLRDDTGLALELLRDVVTRPRLDPAEFERERGQAVDGLGLAREEPQAVIGRYWTTWTFGGHPLGRATGGDERTIAALSMDDVRASAARHLSPSRAWLSVAGDFEPADMLRRIESTFGSWPVTAPAAARLPAWTGSAGGRVLLVDKPDALQTYFRCGNRAFDRSDPDYPARFLANTILGGRFTSRLNKVLRTETGLTYGAGSWFDDDAFGQFAISTYTETARTAECIERAQEIYRRFLAGGLTAEELRSAKTYVKGQFATENVETGAQQAHTILDLAYDGVPRTVIDGLFENLDAVTLEGVNRVIRERFPKTLDWVLVGQASVCRPVAAGLGQVTECSIAGPGWGPAPPAGR